MTEFDIKREFDLYLENSIKNINQLKNQISKDNIQALVGNMIQCFDKGGKLIFCGNGGSASTATHFACDLNKYTSVEGKKRFRALSLEDNIPLLTALVNDEGWDKVYSYQLENLMDDGDYLVVVSVHGGSGKDKAGLWSQNVTLAAKMIHNRGGKVIGLVGFDGGVIKSLADVCITVPINSTPHVEGFHLVLTHMICSIIKDQLSINE